jgi:uncharacterized protein (DUF1800 family)
MDARASYHALYRFGLGPIPGEVQRVGNDPQGWLLEQLQSRALPAALSSISDAPPLRPHLADQSAADKQALGQFLHASKQRFLQHSALRFNVQLASQQPLQERLVLFWSNHFTVSTQKPLIAGLVNLYEVQAIRPNLNLHFEDLLLAVCRHPAMLVYLDNMQSIGPDSAAGQRRGKGLNENLAREVLELHCLGVDGGYRQTDVIALANILTGWSLRRGNDGPELTYAFRPELHQPGSQTLLGQRFSDGGEEQGVHALRMLARHPATARHISRKLAVHFVADQPSAALLERLSQIYLDSNGHLPTLMAAIISAPEAWSAPLSKLKSPYEFALAALRLTDFKPTPEQIIQGLDALNARPFNANSPAGDGDTWQTWDNPDSLLKRITWASRLAQRLPGPSQPVEFAELALGPLLSANSRQTISRAASSQEALALLLASPEFQRR